MSYIQAASQTTLSTASTEEAQYLSLYYQKTAVEVTASVRAITKRPVFHPRSVETEHLPHRNNPFSTSQPRLFGQTTIRCCLQLFPQTLHQKTVL